MPGRCLQRLSLTGGDSTREQIAVARFSVLAKLYLNVNLNDEYDLATAARRKDAVSGKGSPTGALARLTHFVLRSVPAAVKLPVLQDAASGVDVEHDAIGTTTQRVQLGFPTLVETKVPTFPPRWSTELACGTELQAVENVLQAP